MHVPHKRAYSETELQYCLLSIVLKILFMLVQKHMRVNHRKHNRIKNSEKKVKYLNKRNKPFR